MSCKTCNCTKTTTKTVVYTLPDCGNVSKCTEVTDTDCIVYTGTGYPNLGINNGDKLTIVLDKLNALLEGLTIQA